MPSPPPADRFICTHCWRLRAEGKHVDYCKCQSHPPNDDYPDRDLACALCLTCALTVVHGHTRWMLVLCNPCCSRARELNVRHGRLVVPIGIHSLVNGAAFRPEGDGSVDDTKLEAFAGFFRSMIGSLNDNQSYGRRLVKRRCTRLGLMGSDLIDVDEYIAASRESGETEERSWNRYLAHLRRNASTS